MNSMFEEISGIRADAAVGQDITSVARDQGFATLTSDMLDRAPVSEDGLSEDFDFSGIGYRVKVAGLGIPGNTPRGFVMQIARVDE